jgi:cell fate regulator YaaT (PSP1 superfamily)
MAEIVGIRFKNAGKIYYFDPAEHELEVGNQVVVETARGLEVGRVVISPQEMEAEEITKPLKPVVRLAEPDEINHAERYEEKEREAMEECSRLISQLELPMKLLSAEFSLDGRHLTFFFSAEERVDFRQLVRELSGRFKVRVELRQVGARDEAKLLGGFGSCGRQLCCASFLSEFAPISIRMAKQQGLPLNPVKISGICGRLRCCLSYENEQYRSGKERLPKPGQQITTPMGEARVVGGNPLKETVLVELENNVSVEIPLDEVGVGPKPEPESKPAAQRPPRRRGRRR